MLSICFNNKYPFIQSVNIYGAIIANFPHAPFLFIVVGLFEYIQKQQQFKRD